MGAHANLLQIVPELKAEMGGAILAILARDEHLENFCEYLDAISSVRVYRARENMGIEAGNCYLLAASDGLELVRHPAQVLFEKTPATQGEDAASARTLLSAASLFKEACELFIISGEPFVGEGALNQYCKNSSHVMVLSPRECLANSLGVGVARQLAIKKAIPGKKIVERLRRRG
jgi:chemotaxis response regulator CheB